MSHLRCLEDSVNLFAWFMCSDGKEEFMAQLGDFFGAIDFSGQKVVDIDAASKKWYQAFRKVHQDFFEFIKAQHPAILKWNGSNSDSEAFYKNALAGLGANNQASSTAPAPEPKKEEAKAPTSAPAAPVKKPVKQPSKVLKWKLWEISDYGAETLHFKADEVEVGMTFNFFNCNKTKVIIEGRCKNVMFSRCKKVDVKFGSVMSGVEFINCESIKAHILDSVKNIAIERCTEVQIFPNMASKKNLSVMTTAS